MGDLDGTSGDRISLPAISDLFHAIALKAEIEQALTQDNSVTVDASAVQRISTLCLQVLLSAANGKGRKDGPPLTIMAPSAQFLETVSVLGLKETLKVA